MGRAPEKKHLISAGELQARLEAPDLVVLDARWGLESAEAGRLAYEQGHVPGATYVHLHDDLSDPAAAVAGQMPPPEQLAKVLAGLGVGDDTLVVAYDDDVIFTAARLVWMLAVLGHDRAAVLDGGWPAWLAAGGAAASSPPPPRPRGELTVRARPQLRLELDDVKAAVEQSIPLLDCRMDATWEEAGEHIPGARRLSAPALTDPAGGGLESPERTRERLTALGIGRDDPVVLYCGGGVSAARAWLALDAAGYRRAAVYDGSWAEWSSAPELPRARH